jgi:hypothetical protein
MFKNLPRQTFGKLQAKLFPQYFGLSAACITFTIATLALGPGLAKQQAIQLGKPVRDGPSACSKVAQECMPTQRSTVRVCRRTMYECLSL